MNDTQLLAIVTAILCQHSPDAVDVVMPRAVKLIALATDAVANPGQPAAPQAAAPATGGTAWPAQ